MGSSMAQIKCNRRILQLLVFSVSLSLCTDPVFAGSRKKVKGTLEVIVSDRPDGSSSAVSYQVRNNRGVRTKLALRKAPDGLVTGQEVEVIGRAVGRNKIRVANENDLSVLSEPALSGLTGVMNGVVLRIQSNTSVTSASEADLAAEVEAANQRAQEHSFGLVSISNDRDQDGRADVYTVRLNVDSAGVGESQAFTYCNQAIQAAGVTNYRHYICVFSLLT